MCACVCLYVCVWFVQIRPEIVLDIEWFLILKNLKFILQIMWFILQNLIGLILPLLKQISYYYLFRKPKFWINIHTSKIILYFVTKTITGLVQIDGRDLTLWLSLQVALSMTSGINPSTKRPRDECWEVSGREKGARTTIIWLIHQNFVW